MIRLSYGDARLASQVVTLQKSVSHIEQWHLQLS
jgi:hypothetical protein